MADPPTTEETGGRIELGPDRGSPPGTPLWVKVFGIILIALVLLVGIIIFTGFGGHHGPGQHLPFVGGQHGPGHQ